MMYVFGKCIIYKSYLKEKYASLNCVVQNQVY